MNGNGMRMMMAVVGCVLAAACSSGGPTDTIDTDQQVVGGQRLQVRPLFERPLQYSGVEAREREALRSQAEWEAFWTRIEHGSSPKSPPPAVDFAREMVVLAAMGSRGTGGYLITVDSVTATAAATHVFVTERSPGRSCVTTQAVTHPVDAVVVPDLGRQVRFHERIVVHECG